MSSVDLAYQLRAGAGILGGGGIPTSDAWTFTVAGTPWHDQQWGAQAILAAVFAATGWSGLALFRAALVAAAFALLLATVRGRAPWLSRRTGALLVIAAFIVAAPALALRPQLIAIVLFAATLLLLGDRREHPGRVWLVPVLSVLWANIHGSFPLVLVLAGLAWLEDLAERGPRRHLGLAVGVASAVATVINPAGLRVWADAAGVATNPEVAGRVSEWRPPSLFDPPGALFYASLVAVLLVLGAAYLAPRRGAGGRRASRLSWLGPTTASAVSIRRPAWPATLAILGFGGLAVLTARGVAWWPFVAAATVAALLAREPVSASVAIDRRSPANAVIAGAMVVAGVVLLPIWRPIGVANVPVGLVSDAPQGIGSALLEVAVPGERVWNPQIWGSWLELAAPQVLVATDSRIELFPAPIWDTAAAVSGGFETSHQIFDAYRVRTIVTSAVSDTAPEAVLASDAQWQRIYHDADGSIWRRAAPP